MNTNIPQTEKGFLKIASGKSENDILVALIKANLTATQYQIMLIVIRKTWGWNKKEDWISISQFVGLTTKSRKQIIEDIKLLVKRNILVKSTTLGKTNLLRPNKIFSEWIQLVKSTTPVKSSRQTSVVQPTQLVKPTTPTKDNIQKTITKEIIQGIELFKEINPSYRQLFKNKTERASMERLIKQYGFNWVLSAVKRLPEINAMPYSPRVTTPYQLETKLGQIKAFLQQEKNKQTKGGVLQL